MQKTADLHIHTFFSDGSLGPKEVMAQAAKVGLDCIAIADHDSTKAIDVMLNSQDEYGVEVVPAVEITAQEGEKELHILGYFIDHNNEELKQKLKQIREGRKDRVHKMVSKLKQHGINADAEEIFEFAGKGTVGRLHIAKYLLSKGFIPTLKVAFSKYIGDGKPCYVSRFRFSSKQVIAMIKNAGGVAVIAHPGLNNVFEILNALVKSGIEGIEAYHSDQTKKISDKLAEFAREHNLLITGGSDCHGANKKEPLMGKIRLPYEYVEKIKEYRVNRIN